MHICTHTHTHTHKHARTQRIRIHVHINDTSKATKDIADGQELFLRYGSAQWFKSKNISVADVDYASTMWRPDLQPLPCPQSVAHKFGVDGRHSFAVLEDTIPSGAVLEISLCVEVSLNVVDQFPVLWDFVIMDATTQTVCARDDAEVCWQPSILIRTHVSILNPVGMSPYVIRRANPDHTQS